MIIWLDDANCRTAEMPRRRGISQRLAAVYFLKLSFRDTLRLNTRCSAVASRLSRQK